MLAVNGRRRTGLVAAGLTAALTATLPALATGQDEPAPPPPPIAGPAADEPAPSPAGVAGEDEGAADSVRGAASALPLPPTSPKPAHLSLHLHGVHHGKVKVGRKARAVGYLRPFVAKQHVQVKLLRHGHVIQKVNPKARKVRGKNAGRYRFHSSRLIKPAGYRIVARHVANSKQERATARSPRFRIRYPDLDPGDRNSVVRIFNHLLVHEGYYTTHGKHYSARTEWAVMAFRKVNGMRRTYNANPAIFRKLADHRGSFNLKYPGAGRHVEVDISRQVMVLADNGKHKYTFPVSTGAPATPTIRGHFHFYSRQAGYNSHGMYYSVYFHGGYATHGYNPVPPYPASHGCVRNPIPDSRFIYNWIRLGESIYVYG